MYSLVYFFVINYLVNPSRHGLCNNTQQMLKNLYFSLHLVHTFFFFLAIRLNCNKEKKKHTLNVYSYNREWHSPRISVLDQLAALPCSLILEVKGLIPNPKYLELQKEHLYATLFSEIPLFSSLGLLLFVLHFRRRTAYFFELFSLYCYFNSLHVVCTMLQYQNINCMILWNYVNLY